MTNTKTTKPSKQTNSHKQAMRITLAICFGPPIISVVLVMLTQANLLDGFMGMYRNTPLQELVSDLFYGSIIYSPLLALAYTIWRGLKQRTSPQPISPKQVSRQPPKPLRPWLKLTAIPAAIIVLYVSLLTLPTLADDKFWRSHFTAEGRCRAVEQPNRTIWNKELRQRINTAENDCINGDISVDDYRQVIDDVQRTIRRDPEINSSRQPQTICTHQAGPDGQVTNCSKKY